jgi:hypothetical protein
MHCSFTSGSHLFLVPQQHADNWIRCIWSVSSYTWWTIWNTNTTLTQLLTTGNSILPTYPAQIHVASLAHDLGRRPTADPAALCESRRVWRRGAKKIVGGARAKGVRARDQSIRWRLGGRVKLSYEKYVEWKLRPEETESVLPFNIVDIEIKTLWIEKVVNVKLHALATW